MGSFDVSNPHGTSSCVAFLGLGLVMGFTISVR